MMCPRLVRHLYHHVDRTLTIYNRLKRSFEMSKRVKFIFVYCSSIHKGKVYFRILFKHTCTITIFSNFDSFQNHDSVYFMWNAILMVMVNLVHLKGMGNTAFRGAIPKHSTLLKLRKFSLFSQNNIYCQVWSKHEHEIQVYVWCHEFNKVLVAKTLVDMAIKAFYTYLLTRECTLT